LLTGVNQEEMQNMNPGAFLSVGEDLERYDKLKRKMPADKASSA
jgi:hypothetical protein